MSPVENVAALRTASGTLEILGLPADRDGLVWLHRGRGSGFLHRHAELEINLCVAGSADYIVDNQRFALTRRTALWLFPAQEHVLLARSDDFQMWIAVWKPGLIERACRQQTHSVLRKKSPGEAWIARLGSDDATDLSHLFLAIQNEKEEDAFNAGLAWLLMQCFAAWRRSQQPVAGHAVHPAAERAARLLREESLGARELARRVGLSPSRLSRVFHQQIGQTLTQFRTQSSVERFLQDYDGHNSSLTEAALRAGFGSYAQFHRALKEHTGLAPAEYRTHLRAG